MPPSEYSALILIGIIAQAGPRALWTRVGAFKGGMTEVMIEPIVEYLQSQGCEVKTAAPVSQILIKQGRVTGVVVNNQLIPAQCVIVATGLGPAQTLIKASVRDDQLFSNLLHLPSMPEINMQIELRQPAESQFMPIFMR